MATTRTKPVPPPKEMTRNQVIKAIKIARHLTRITDHSGPDTADHFRAIVEEHPDFARSVEKKTGITESSITTWEIALTMIEEHVWS